MELITDGETDSRFSVGDLFGSTLVSRVELRRSLVRETLESVQMAFYVIPNLLGLRKLLGFRNAFRLSECPTGDRTAQGLVQIRRRGSHDAMQTV
jgi:hypothetical protein